MRCIKDQCVRAEHRSILTNMPCHCEATSAEETCQVLLRLDRIELLLQRLNEEGEAATLGQRKRREHMRTIARKFGSAMLQKVLRELLAKDTGIEHAVCSQYEELTFATGLRLSA